MLIFPILYLGFFVMALTELIRGQRQGFLLFVIFGLPIYVTTLSIVFSSGFENAMAAFQSAKELIMLIVLGIGVWTLRAKIIFHLIDYLVIAFFLYTLMYVFIPVGDHDLIERAVAFKSISFLGIVYAAGRLFSLKDIYISKYFHYILLVSISAVFILLFEVITNKHFQFYTGYADYNVNFLNFAATGDEGLTFTFETENGLKRFASFFSNPLEYAAASLLSLAVIGGLYTRDDHKFKPDTFGVAAFLATFIAILFTISRAAFVSYFLVIYIYALRTNKKAILYSVNGAILAGVILLFMTKSDDIVKFIVNTVNFTDSSSVGHVLDWLAGIAAIKEQPLGLGLAESGRLAVTLGTNTGGHNQFLIIGVQAGIIAMGLYTAIYIALIATAWRWVYRLHGKAKQICIAVLLIKVGLFIPLFTSEMETSSYISYLTWFFSGLFVSIISKQKSSLVKLTKEHPVNPELKPLSHYQ